MKVGIVICAKNALLKDGSKSNWIDARKLAALLTFPYADWKRRIATTWRSQYTQIQYARFR
jgi:hypothetical protein